MRLTNKTHWDSKDLKKVIKKVFDQEVGDKPRWRWQRIEVVYSRGYWFSGVATLGGHWIRMKVPKKDFCPRRFADILTHEFQHNLGQRHREMVCHHGVDHFDYVKDLTVNGK